MQLSFLSGGRTIQVDAHEPQAATPHAAIVLLHGAGGNAGYWTSRFGPLLAGSGVALYAPHYFQRTGTAYADLATINDGVHVPQWLETVEDVLHFVAARPGVDPSRLALIGISLGAFLSLAFAATHSAPKDPTHESARRIRALVAISGGLVEPYATAATPQFPPTLIIHGDADTVVPVTFARQLDGKLTQLNVPHETRILRGESHYFTPPALMEIGLALSQFLSQHLR